MDKTIEAFDILIATLISFWQFDIWVFSQWWLYAPLLIPFVFYFAFFSLKWTILTAPIWIPLKHIFGKTKDDTKDKS